MIVQCGVEIWANVCIHVCKMSCNWALHVNYAHRRNAIEELRDRRQRGYRERRTVVRQQKTYMRCSQHLASESQRRAQETEEHRQ